MVKKSKKDSSKASKNLEVRILNSKGKDLGSLSLDASVFDGKVNISLIHQAVVAYLANKRSGLAKTKTRGDVSGGGVKPWRQKGTGRARVGSIRSPLWRGGGVTFGPQPHSFRKDLPKKMKTLALKSALNAKVNDQEVLILKDLKLDSHKTKEFATIVSNLNLGNTKVRLVVSELTDNIKLATRNLNNVLLAKAKDVNTIEVVDCKKLVFTEEALREIEERVKRST